MMFVSPRSVGLRMRTTLVYRIEMMQSPGFLHPNLKSQYDTGSETQAYSSSVVRLLAPQDALLL